jgi:hypothetical protein
VQYVQYVQYRQSIDSILMIRLWNSVPASDASLHLYIVAWD